MSTARARPARARLVANICGWLAVMPLTALLVWWAALLATLRGSDRIMLITPAGFFVFTAIAWVAFAAVAIVLGVRGGRSRLAVTLGVVALVEVVVGVALLFVV